MSWTAKFQMMNLYGRTFFVTALFLSILFLISPAFSQDGGHGGHPAAQGEVKKQEEKAPQVSSGKQKPATAGKKKDAGPAKQAEIPVTITLSEQKRQLIGVRTAIAGVNQVARTIRTLGKVEVDETKLAFVNTKIAGWVRKLHVDYTGKEVNKGEPMLSIYSPDLVSAQDEYLLAVRSPRSGEKSGFSEVTEAQDSLIESAKQRLLLWDITPAQIAELEKTGKPRTEMTILAPINGIVLEKMVLEGGYIMPGMNLYKIVDLSSVWIIADIYEYEVPLIRINQKARVSLAYLPGQAFTARVSYIAPTLDPMTRTVKVRLEVANENLIFKPEMFANVEISSGGGSALTIPTEAVLDSGLRKIVYVEKEPGVYEMREVRLGLRGEETVEILSGIKKGERVVTSGNFLIDSESQLRAGPGGGGHAH